jgi:ribonuclease PH
MPERYAATRASFARDSCLNLLNVHRVEFWMRPSCATKLACRILLVAGKISASPIRWKVAAVSVGLVEGEAFLDLNYEEDKEASVDMNLVMPNVWSSWSCKARARRLSFR